jgi:hypothetical protein
LNDFLLLFPFDPLCMNKTRRFISIYSKLDYQIGFMHGNIPNPIFFSGSWPS